MLSPEEKKEMLEDAKSVKRRNDFRIARQYDTERPFTFSEYISFLNGVQKVFGPFKISKKPTITKFNRL